MDDMDFDLVLKSITTLEGKTYDNVGHANEEWATDYIYHKKTIQFALLLAKKLQDGDISIGWYMDFIEIPPYIVRKLHESRYIVTDNPKAVFLNCTVDEFSKGSILNSQHGTLKDAEVFLRIKNAEYLQKAMTAQLIKETREEMGE